MSPKSGARLHLRQAALEALVGHLDQPPRARRDVADAVHAAVSPCQPSTMTVTSMLAMSPSRSGALAGDAVADHVVGRDAQRLGVAAVEQAGGQRAVVEDELARQPVEVVGDHAGPTCGVSMSRHSAARRPARRMPSKAPGPVWILISPVRVSASSIVDEGHVVQSLRVARHAGAPHPAYVATLARNFNFNQVLRASPARHGMGAPMRTLSHVMSQP